MGDWSWNMKGAAGLENRTAAAAAKSSPAAAAGVGLLCRLVERLRLQREVVTLGHEVVQLLAPLQHRRDRAVQDDLCLVQLILHLRHRVHRRRVLVRMIMKKIISHGNKE